MDGLKPKNRVKAVQYLEEEDSLTQLECHFNMESEGAEQKEQDWWDEIRINCKVHAHHERHIDMTAIYEVT